ncbi:MAG: hypothetical protein EZS28_018608 [Streblomastix strix]|uniref:Uncharacterized protein n=1 Tax=Streblomastix strix TaxID=222440 RepID=A0A5J4VT83_9EUKA|nr:MAG: hypothetical protein EZS28_018608 [Streblomastix strix]
MFLNDQKLSDNVYAVQMNPEKCTVLIRISFISQKEKLTQRIWLKVETKMKSVKQQFKYVIKDQQFYNENAKYFFPTIEGDLLDEKKILGLAVEREGTEMIALAPKNYYIMVDDKTKLKLKGINQSTNKITKAQIVENIIEGTVTKCVNMRLGQKSYQMSKLSIEKNGITGCRTKAIVLSNQSCCPFIFAVSTTCLQVRAHKLLMALIDEIRVCAATKLDPSNSLKYLRYFSNLCDVFVMSKFSNFFICYLTYIPSKSSSVFTYKGLYNKSKD